MPLLDTDCCASYKVLILGEAFVGKTALLNSLTGKGFKESMVPTIGVDFVKKIFEVDGAIIQLVIWDTAGQERFRSITRWQLKGVQGIVLVYDVTDSTSFNLLKYWSNTVYKGIKHSHNQYEPIPIIICGNKCDLNEARQVQTRTAFDFAEKQMAFEFFETSAKTGENVFAAFQRLAFHITDICDPKYMASYHPCMIRDGVWIRPELLLKKKKVKKNKLKLLLKAKKPKSEDSQSIMPKQFNTKHTSMFKGFCCISSNSS